MQRPTYKGYYPTLCLTVVLYALIFSGCSTPKPAGIEPLEVQEQDSFAVGGSVNKQPGTVDPYQPTPEGPTFRGDHAYVLYQIPIRGRPCSLVLWYGYG